MWLLFDPEMNVANCRCMRATCCEKSSSYPSPNPRRDPGGRPARRRGRGRRRRCSCPNRFAPRHLDRFRPPPMGQTPSPCPSVSYRTFLRDYGPNKHVLRIVSMDSFGGGDPSHHPRFQGACPRCGLRFDGKEMQPGAPA
ncbi:hypothetical protein sr17016 [Sporisorium reilianum SRZ2]|uniref:Uncharacterized protein n=1 Tax=Sporisorium reilianum (strain SRZ2) TaxID=999809 RepID=E6ZNU5_SPORE|nr:hypothetical protein sr17016 [Sporisorium reilianum SRZ2]